MLTLMIGCGVDAAQLVEASIKPSSYISSQKSTLGRCVKTPVNIGLVQRHMAGYSNNELEESYGANLRMSI